MAKPEFKFYLDTLNDGTFAANITTKVISADWQLGFAAPFDKMARDNTASFVVNNVNRDFSPEYASGAYYGNLTTGRAIKVTSTYASVTRTMWLGWIASIAPTSNSNGTRQSTINCSGWMERALRKESLIPIQLNKRADEIIAVILDESDILPPSVIGVWILGNSLLGSNTILGAVSDYYSADVGDSTFAFAGDWEANTSVHSAIMQTVDREAGRFFQKRDGKLQFYRRLHFPTDVTSLVTLTDKNSEMDYEFGADVANIVQVQYQPRSVGTVGDTVATLSTATAIGAASTLEIEYRFTDGAGTAIGATALITPAATTDYTVFANDDGTGANLTANVTASITRTNATAATVQYTNTGAAGYVMPTSKLRGTPLTKYELQTYTATDETSLLAYGKLGYTSNGVQDTLTDATTLADYELSLFKDPVGRVNNVTFAGWDTTLTATLLTYSIGTRITMHETQTGVNGDWFVLGETHRYNSGDWRVQWVLEDAGTIVYWALGAANYSELGDTTILGPL